MAFSILYNNLCNHHYPILEHSSPQKETPYVLIVTFHFPLSQSPATTNLLSVFMELSVTYVSYFWNHKMWLGLFQL